MDEKFQQILKKILKKHLDDIVFIEMKEGKKIQISGFETPEGFLLPVFIQDLAEKIKENEIDNIPITAILKGLVYSVGAQAEINFLSMYETILLSLDASIVQSILNDGIRYANERNYSTAILYFNAAVLLDANNLDAYYNMGRAFEALSEVEERTDLKKLVKYCYEKCVNIDPSFAYSYFNLGIIYYNEGNYQKAETNWIKALSYDLPEEMREEIATGLGKVRDRATFEKGYQYVLAGRIDDGLELLKALEEEHDEWWDLMFYIGLGNRMLEQYEDALSYFLKVMTLNTGHIQTMNEIGICLMSLGDYDEAEKYYKEALRLSPENAELMCNMGIVKYSKGNTDEALNLIERAIEIAPDDEVAAMWLAHIQSRN